jgi:hypothetical protein
LPGNLGSSVSLPACNQRNCTRDRELSLAAPAAYLAVFPVEMDVLVANFVAPVNEYNKNYQYHGVKQEPGNRD